MTNYQERAERSDLYPVATAIWRAEFGIEPTEPLDTKGGAWDAGAWCMKLAEAIADGRPQDEWPPLASDRPTLEGSPAVLAAKAALEQTRAS